MATHQKKNDNRKINKKHDFVTALTDQTYAIITLHKGDARFDVKIIRTGKTTFVRAPGKLQRGPKKQRIMVGDTVLITEGPNAEIITKYSDEEIKRLIKMGELVSLEPKINDISNIVFENDVSVLNTHEEVELNIDDI